MFLCLLQERAFLSNPWTCAILPASCTYVRRTTSLGCSVGVWPENNPSCRGIQLSTVWVVHGLPPPTTGEGEGIYKGRFFVSAFSPDGSMLLPPDGGRRHNAPYNRGGTEN